MSFQRKQVGRREMPSIRRSQSIEGGSKGEILDSTASSGIDPMPLPTCPCGDDIPVEACNNSPHGKRFFKTFVPISEKVVPLQRLYQWPNSSRDRTEVS